MLIISHRGASGYAPENTLKAFELALSMGAKNFEFDVHLTRDKVLVVHHDYTLKKTAGAGRHCPQSVPRALRAAGADAKISDLNFADLKKFNVARHPPRASNLFQHAPGLDEVMEIIGQKSELINFEIKNDGNVYPGIEKAVIRFIKSQNVFKKSVVSSFDRPTMKRMRTLDADIRLGFLRHKLLPSIIAESIKQAKLINCESFHINARLVLPCVVEKIHNSGLQVYVYTVNTKKEAVQMLDIGVDGIFSDFPDILEK
ncbi:MAG: hypothetical protein HY746_00100 [Elusimicrobia bacterium]|nr:hypothetical protein [Elusimicrobiota bacterium]